MRILAQADLAQHASAWPMLPIVRLFGLPIVNAPTADVLDWLSTQLSTGQRTRVAFVNAHCINQAAPDEAYADALASADAILPDGSGIALAACLQGTRIVENLNGTDLIPAFTTRLAAMGRSIFLLGGQPGVAAAAADELVRVSPGLRIAGTRHGFFQPDEEAAVIDEINASGADVVLVAFGVPRQETWLQRVAPKLDATLSFGVGGLFDFLSGRIPRAPKLLREMGLEWTYRLYQEPGRLFHRYILGNPRFVLRALGDALAAPVARLDMAAKRLLDIIGAATGLLLLSPVLLLIGLIVRATTPGPAILRQTRIGKDGAPFRLYKFRSMYVDAEARRAALEAQNQHGPDGITFKLKQDCRITPVGRLLRRASIDELPQLWNVLIGDMSLVGPRPPLPHEVARYNAAQRRRLHGKPGLTCLWQVMGRADIAFERQVELDVEYLQRRTVWLDLAILLRTVPAVLTARGAY